MAVTDPHPLVMDVVENQENPVQAGKQKILQLMEIMCDDEDQDELPISKGPFSCSRPETWYGSRTNLTVS